MNNDLNKSDFVLLKKIYGFYDQVIETTETDMACKKKCSSCCTCNVTLTSLEAEFLIAFLTDQKKNKLISLVRQGFPEKRYIPAMTSNSFARMCMQGREIPCEENDPSWGGCPLLVDDMCVFYDVRPFGCRALMSEVQCRKNGYAQIPPMVLTINNLFLQFIEHVDQNGVFGNLSDIINLFLSGDSTDKIQNRTKKNHDGNVLSNENITVLMVPPEHREKIRPISDKLSCLVFGE